MLNPSLFTTEVTVQLLELRHQIRVETRHLDAGIAKAELATTADRVVRIERADHDSPDSPLDNSLCTWDLRTIACGARLKRREERRACQRLETELPLKKRELGVITGGELQPSPALRALELHILRHDPEVARLRVGPAPRSS